MNIQTTKEITKIECCNCGVDFWVSEALRQNWLKTKETFYCPNGHGQSYCKSTADKLQEQLRDANLKINQKDLEIQSLKGLTTKLEEKLNNKKNGRRKRKT